MLWGFACFLSYGCVFLWFEEVFLYDLIENFVYTIDLGFFSPSLPIIQRYCFVFLFVLFCFYMIPCFLCISFLCFYFFVFFFFMFLVIWFKTSLLSPRLNLSFAWFILLIKLSFAHSHFLVGILGFSIPFSCQLEFHSVSLSPTESHSQPCLVTVIAVSLCLRFLVSHYVTPHLVSLSSFSLLPQSCYFVSPLNSLISLRRFMMGLVSSSWQACLSEFWRKDPGLIFHSVVIPVMRSFVSSS